MKILKRAFSEPFLLPNYRPNGFTVSRVVGRVSFMQQQNHPLKFCCIPRMSIQQKRLNLIYYLVCLAHSLYVRVFYPVLPDTCGCVLTRQAGEEKSAVCRSDRGPR